MKILLFGIIDRLFPSTDPADEAINSLKSSVSRIRSYVSLAGSVRGRVVRGTFWLLTSTVLSQILGMVVGILSARILGQSGFGELGMMRNFIFLLGLLLGNGLGIAATKHVAEFRESDPLYARGLVNLILRAGFLLGFVGTALCFLLAPLVAFKGMLAPQMAAPIKISSLVLALNVLIGTQLGITAGLEAFRLLAKLTVAQGGLNLLFVPIGAYCYGTAGAVGGYAAGTALAVLVNHVALRNVCFRFNMVLGEDVGWKEGSRVLWGYSVPAVLTNFTIQVPIWFVWFLLSRRSDGFAELGLLVAAQSWGIILQMVPGQIVRSSRPILANLYARGQNRSFRRVVLANTGVISAFCVAMATPMLLLSSFLMGMYGASFSSGRSVLAVMLFVYSVAGVNLMLGLVLEATGRMWTRTMVLAVRGACIIALGLPLLSHGALGLAGAYAGGQLLVAFMLVILVAIILRDLPTTEGAAPLTDALETRKS